MKRVSRLILTLIVGLWMHGASAGGKLLATGGVMQIEGAAGGGLVPWALIGGLGTEDEVGAALTITGVGLDDYRLQSTGVLAGIYDRVEVSYARQDFRLTGRVLPGNRIRQEIFGLKVKLAGDAVADQDRWWPQVSLGLQAKRNLDFAFIPSAVGARKGQGIDFYLAATKLYLGALGGRNLLLNGTLRASKANQLGLLGFGGDRADRHRLRFEGSAAFFLNDQLAFGAEYRAKPDNLSAFREEAWKDLFVAWLPVKPVAVTLAYAHLGEIAGIRQSGWYLSMQLSY